MSRRASIEKRDNGIDDRHWSLRLAFHLAPTWPCTSYCISNLFVKIGTTRGPTMPQRCVRPGWRSFAACAFPAGDRLFAFVSVTLRYTTIRAIFPFSWLFQSRTELFDFVTSRRLILSSDLDDAESHTCHFNRFLFSCFESKFAGSRWKLCFGWYTCALV